METIYYTVARIDGDYAYLKNDDRPDLEEMCVARALLPYEINEGTKLKFEDFLFEIV